MTQATGTRALLVVLVLAISIVPGWLIGQGAATQKALPAPQSWKLTVGPDPCTVSDTDKGTPVDKAVVDKRKGHWIQYEPSPKEKDVLRGIILHGPADDPSKPFQKPFRNVAFAGSDSKGMMLWAVPCSYSPKNICKTGPVEKDAVSGEYKTDQDLRGKKPCDAGIIIQP